VDGIGFEVYDFVEIFETHDGEGRPAETVFDRVLEGFRPAFGGCGDR
jgi:hypothetical protein